MTQREQTWLFTLSPAPSSPCAPPQRTSHVIHHLSRHRYTMFSSQRVAPSPWTQRATANMAHNQYFNFIPPVDNPNPYPVLVKFTPYGDDGDTYIGSLERCSWVKMVRFYLTNTNSCCVVRHRGQNSLNFSAADVCIRY